MGRGAKVASAVGAVIVVIGAAGRVGPDPRAGRDGDGIWRVTSANRCERGPV